MSSAQQHKEGEHNRQDDSSDSDDEQRDQKVVSPDVSSSPDKKRSKPSMSSMSTPTMPIQIASNKIKDNDHDHQQQMSPAAASSSIASPSSNSREHSSSSLPLWVAGSSPAKFVSLEDLIKMGDSIEKMAIVHQIAVDPKCTVEDLRPPQSPIYEQVKSSMHKAYWDLLRADLAEHPPKTEHAFALFEDLKKMITDHLESANLKNALAAVDEALDLDHLRQLLHRGQLHFPTHLHSILAILERLCAPVRDDLVAKLREEADTVELFRGIFNLVELMQLDMANFTLSQNRQLIGSYSAKIEFDEFQKLLAIDKSAADNTRLWLRQVLMEYFEQNQPEDGPRDGEDEELSRSTVNELIVQFYVRLLETPANRRPHPFPETLRLDMARIEALGEKQLQLELAVGALFVTTNLAGKAAASEGQRNNNFKAELKRQLLVLLNDVSWDNYPEKLENVALQCMKQCKQAAVSADGCWPEERSQLLRQQILGLANPEDSVRTIARNRIRDFICQALRQTSQPLRIPLGLSVAQTELASLTSRFYAVATHNWTAFGRFYGQLLEEEQYTRMEGEKRRRRRKNIGGDGDNDEQ